MAGTPGNDSKFRLKKMSRQRNDKEFSQNDRGYKGRAGCRGQYQHSGEAGRMPMAGQGGVC